MLLNRLHKGVALSRRELAELFLFPYHHRPPSAHRAMSSRSQSTPGNEDDDTSSSSAGEDTAATRTATGASASAAAAAAEKKVSCQPCREAKVKCIPSTSPGTACSRCLKLERECFYRTHKRGRKPGKIKLQQILRRLELLDRTLHEIKELNKEVADADATSLIETLMWQLHRSKFFSKGTDPAAAAGVKRERHTSSSPAGNGAEADKVAMGGVMGMGSGVQKSRSDFNMLVDMEDHASVARVPDEFPTLSNPLKLLAQASSDESERRLRTRSTRLGVERANRQGSGLRRQTNFDEAGTSASGSGDEENDQEQVDRDRATSSHDQPGSDGDPARKRARSRSPTPTTSSTSITAPAASTTSAPPVTATSTRTPSSWASTYFSRGAFHPVYDNRQEFDPIDQNLLTVAQASRLITSFYASFGTFMHIFDPTLSTITYIRKHSAFLLTVICALSAEFESSADPHVQAESATLAVSLRRHYEEMI